MGRILPSNMIWIMLKREPMGPNLFYHFVRELTKKKNKQLCYIKIMNHFEQWTSAKNQTGLT